MQLEDVLACLGELTPLGCVLSFELAEDDTFPDTKPVDGLSLASLDELACLEEAL